MLQPAWNIERFVLSTVIVLGILTQSGCRNGSREVSADTIDLMFDVDCQDSLIQTRGTKVSGFVTTYLTAYYAAVDSILSSRFRDSAEFSSNRPATVLGVLSSRDDWVIYATKSDTLRGRVLCSDLPAQFAFFCTLVPEVRNKFDLTSPTGRADAINWFDTSKVDWFLGIIQNAGVHLGFSYRYYVKGPKTINVHPGHISMFYHCVFDLDSTFLTPTHKEIRLPGVLLVGNFSALTESKDLVHAWGWIAGMSDAHATFFRLLKSSEFFRRAQLHEELRVKLREIQERSDNARRSGTDSYPLWERQMDMSALKVLASREGIDATYIDDLSADLNSQSISGTLFWNYRTNWGFTFQWIVMNLFMLIFSLVVILLRQKSILLNYIASVALSLIVISSNATAFAKRPSDLHLGYWIAPGAIMIGALIVQVYLVKLRSATNQ